MVLAIIGVLAWPRPSHALFGIGDIVFDPSLNATLKGFQTAELAQWAEHLLEWAKHIEQTAEMIGIIDRQLEVMGNPEDRRIFEGLRRFLEKILEVKGDVTIEEIINVADGLKSLKRTEDGLYVPIFETTSTGGEIDYKPEEYRRYAALEEAADGYKEMDVDTHQRIDQLIEQIQALREALQSAETLIDLNRVQGQIALAQMELTLYNMKLSNAANRVVARHAVNSTYDDKRDTALEDFDSADRAEFFEEFREKTIDGAGGK